MKKVLLSLVMLMVGMVINAQDNPLTNGIYEKKVVVTADSVKASTLYVRALEALSDWAGSQQRSKANVDVQDKDEGLVIYKGALYLGYGKKNIAYGYDIYANFTMKVKCRDGRVMIMMAVPSGTFHWTANNSQDSTYPIGDLYPEFKDNVSKVLKKTCEPIVRNLTFVIDGIINNIGEKITRPIDDF